MKCKVGVFQVSHKADMEIEVENKMEAVEKVRELLDTENGTFMLVVEVSGPEPVVSVCPGHNQVVDNEIQRIIDEGTKTNMCRM